MPQIPMPDIGLPLLIIWLGVAAVLLGRTLRDLIAVERLVARAQPADLPKALQMRMKGVRVVVSPEAPGPMAAGLLRPAIVLPESIALASPGMAALLEHEHAHIRRRDMLAALGQRICASCCGGARRSTGSAVAWTKSVKSPATKPLSTARAMPAPSLARSPPRPRTSSGCVRRAWLLAPLVRARSSAAAFAV